MVRAKAQMKVALLDRAGNSRRPHRARSRASSCPGAGWSRARRSSQGRCPRRRSKSARPVARCCRAPRRSPRSGPIKGLPSLTESPPGCGGLTRSARPPDPADSPQSRRKRHPCGCSRKPGDCPADKSGQPPVALPSSLPTDTNPVPLLRLGRKTEALRIVSFAITFLAGGIHVARLCPASARAVESVRVDPEHQGDRPHPGDRALSLGRRRDPDLDRAGPRRHRPPHRREGARIRHPAGLDRLRAHQRHRRAGRPASGRAAFPADRFGRDLARSRRDRASPRSRRARASARSATTAPMRTSS